MSPNVRAQAEKLASLLLELLSLDERLSVETGCYLCGKKKGEDKSHLRVELRNLCGRKAPLCSRCLASYKLVWMGNYDLRDGIDYPPLEFDDAPKLLVARWLSIKLLNQQKKLAKGK